MTGIIITQIFLGVIQFKVLPGFISDQGHGGGAETSQCPTGVSQGLHTSYSFKGR